jgi:hypothetical protein
MTRRRAHWRRFAAPAAPALLLAAFAVGLGPATAQQLPQPVVGKPGGLLPNGGFDIGDRMAHPIAWSILGASDDVKVMNVAADRTAGLGGLQIADSNGESVSVLSDWIAAAAGQQYTVTAELRAASGTAANLSLRFYDFNRTALSTQMATIAPGTGWQTVTASGVAPANTSLVSVIISTAATGTSYWDEMNLSEATPAYNPALGSSRELFLDDYRIDSTSNVGRVVHPAQKTPLPVLRADQPWESSAYIYGSVYQIGDVYRMWYTCYNDVAPNYYLCYAESKDGTHWTKPHVGSIGYKDIPADQTNIVAATGGTVAYNPTAPADRRYALLYFHTGTVNDTLGYYAMFSPDGYHWTSAQDKPVLLDGDVSNVVWDGHRYIASIKKRMFTSRTPGIYDRSAFVATSADFIHWTNPQGTSTTPQLAVTGDYADDGAAEAINGVEGQVYGMPVIPYESTYLGIPWMLLITDYTTGASASAGDGPVLPEIASSRDLVDWQRPVRDPIIQPGQPGAWDDGTIYTASDAIVTDKTISLYYGGFNVGHGGVVAGDPSRDHQVGQIGIATWRRDGIVSLTNASVPGTGDPGQVTTKPVTFSGDTLHVNATVRPQGSLKVEVLDATTGQPVPGYSATISGDHLDAAVHFPGQSLATLSQPVKLRFSLINTDLYSYWVTD